jgi:uncharacterized membrane protein YeaQ/YmgE (transglycosylase-associated protein family)
MNQRDYTMQSNPARAIAARIVVGAIGALLVYFALPNPIGVRTLWAESAFVPLAIGAAAVVFALVAPRGWCEALIP